MGRQRLWLYASLLVSSPALAECPSPAPGGSALQLALEEADDAVRALDSEAFEARMAEAGAIIGCVEELLSRGLIASYHRSQAYRAALSGDQARASYAFMASRAIEPGYRIPEALFTAGSEVASLYERSAPGGVVAPLEGAAEGELRFDGRASPERPADRATLLQHVGGGGEVLLTAYLWPEDPLPEGLLFPVEEAPAEASGGGGRLRVTLVAAAAVSALAAGALYGSALQGKDKYWNDAELNTEALLDDQRARVNALSASALGAGALAVGAGVAAVITW